MNGLPMRTPMTSTWHMLPIQCSCMAKLRRLGHGSVPLPYDSNIVAELHAWFANANAHDRHVASAAYTVSMHG